MTVRDNLVRAMYVKVFSQILESSIARDYNQRRMFMDLLVLADREGVVDMTHDAISRRLNVPIQVIKRDIHKLEQPDPESRGEEEEGRRIIRLDSHRDWGWLIVNYKFYRDLRDMEALRVANRDRKRRERERKKEKTPSDVPPPQSPPPLTPPKETNTFSYSEVTLSHAGHDMSQDVRDIHSPNGETPAAKKKKDLCRPKDLEECKNYVVSQLGLPENDAFALWEHWKGNGFTNNGKEMKNWQAVASNWERRDIFFPSKKKPFGK